MDSTRFLMTPLNDTFGLVIESSAQESIKTLPAPEVIALFKKHGTILFRNFAVETKDFLEFTEAYCKDFSTYQGGGFRWGSLDRQKVNNNETLLTVTGATQSFGIPPHGEMYYMGRKPTMLWFYCDQPPIEAGETTLCDGIELYNQLSDGEREYFAQQRLKYIRHLMDGEWQTAFQTEDLNEVRRLCAENDSTITENADGSISIEYVCSATHKERRGDKEVFINSLLIVHSVELSIRSGIAAKAVDLPRNACPLVVRLENGSELPASLVEQVERTANEMSVRISWKKGDILMIDNTRVLHGRRKCRGTERQIYVRMAEPAFAF